jgi:four helix bundle protein
MAPRRRGLATSEHVNPPIESFRDLVAWQKAFALGVKVHRMASELPDTERFGLAGQLRRGAVATASNIAEGYGRGSRSDYIRFLKIARGALYELDTQLMFAVELAYIERPAYEETKSQLDESERDLAGLISSLEP